MNGVHSSAACRRAATTVTFEMSGMATIKKETDVSLGRTVTVDTTMALSGVSENVTVAAETAPVVTNPTTGANYTPGVHQQRCPPAARRSSSPSSRPASPTTVPTPGRSPSAARSRATTCS